MCVCLCASMKMNADCCFCILPPSESYAQTITLCTLPICTVSFHVHFVELAKHACNSAHYTLPIWEMTIKQFRLPNLPLAHRTIVEKTRRISSFSCFHRTFCDYISAVCRAYCIYADNGVCVSMI